MDKAIVDLNRTVPSSFVVVDGLVDNQSEARFEDRVKMDLIVAGRDAVSMDTVCAKIIGFDPSKIRTISLACEEGLGIGGLQEIKVRGASIDSVMCKFRDPQSAFVETYPGLSLLDEQACTACEGELQSPLFYIRQAGLADQLRGLTVIMGKQAITLKVDCKVLFMGQCVREFRDKGPFVDGCPPHGGWTLTEKICEIYEIDKKAVVKSIEKVHKKIDEIR